MDNEEKNAHLESRVADLEAALNLPQASHIAMTMNLPLALARLLGLFLAVPCVTQEMVVHRLEIATDMKVAVFRLRRALKERGIVIHARRSVGYWMEQADKDIIRAELKQREAA